MYATYERDTGDVEACKVVLQHATKALPTSEVLKFVLADVLEVVEGKFEEANRIYEAMVEQMPSNAAFIQYQLFARRNFGVPKAREVFRQAREWEGVQPEVYLAYAELERCANKNLDVCRNVYELCLARWPRDPLSCQHYLTFLLHSNNDDSAIQEGFQLILANLDQEDALPFWKQYRAYVHRMRAQGGDLAYVETLEAGIAEAFPLDKESKGLYRLAHRYRYLGCRPDTGAPDKGFYALLDEAQGVKKPERVERKGPLLVKEEKRVENSSNKSKLGPLLNKLIRKLPQRAKNINYVKVDDLMARVVRSQLVKPLDPQEVKKQRSGQDAGAKNAPKDVFKERHEVQVKRQKRK